MPKKTPLRQRPAFKKIVEQFKQPGERDLLWYHLLGKRVAALCPSSDRGYGTERIPKLDDAVRAAAPNAGIAAAVFWTARRFYDEYPDAEILTKWSTPNSRGYRLYWGHMQVLLTIHDHKKRHRIANRCLANGWSVHQLRRQVQFAPGWQRRARGQRPVTPAKSAEDLLQRLIKETEGWVRRVKQLVGVNGKISAVESWVKSKDQRKSLEAMADRARRGLDDMRRLTRRITKSLS